MSNYTAKRRSGGGQVNAAPTAFMEEAGVQSDFIIDITYNRPVNVALFDPSNFSCPLGPAEGVDIAQISSNVLEVTFDNEVTLEANLTYSGSSVAALSPQTIALT